MRVDDKSARYPLEIDPFVQQAKLTASDGATPNDVLGTSVAVSGDTVVAGAPADGLHGNAGQGSVYVFQKPPSGWVSATETAQLTASDGAELDQFGSSVAIFGDTIVAGAPGSNAGQGSAYLFQKPAAGWMSATETAKLTASDGAQEDLLGSSVAVSGDTVIAGAPGDDGSTADQGSVYVFQKPATGWTSGTETAKLTASGAVESLGASVAIFGDTVVAGAPRDLVGTIRQGSAYVFQKPATGWTSGTETAKLTASDGAQEDLLGGRGAGARGHRRHARPGLRAKRGREHLDGPSGRALAESRLESAAT